MIPFSTSTEEPEETAGAVDLAALVASRLCHDLISPIGAVANGVELLGMAGIAGAELDLIAESAGGASARVRFMRIAFGEAGDGQTIDAVQIEAVLNDPHRGARTDVRWNGPALCARSDAKLAFLLLMCAESALPRGGGITVTIRDGELSVDAAGALRIDSVSWAHLTDAHAAPVAPGSVQFPLAAAVARARSRRIAVEFEDGALSIKVSRA